MTDEQQSPTTTVPESPELSASEGVRNAEEKASTPETSQTATPKPGDGQQLPREVQLINEATGRNYKTVEEAQKGLKETASYVGTLGQRASLVEKLAKKIAKENNVSEEAALKYVQQLAEAESAQMEEPQTANEVPTQDAPAKPMRSPQDFHVERMQEQLQELQLLRKYPEAESQVKLIRSIAKADGRDYEDVYENDIRPLVQAGKNQAYESQEQKGGASVVSTAKEGREPDEYSKVFKSFQQGKASVVDVLKAKGIVKR